MRKRSDRKDGWTVSGPPDGASLHSSRRVRIKRWRWRRVTRARRAEHQRNATEIAAWLENAMSGRGRIIAITADATDCSVEVQASYDSRPVLISMRNLFAWPLLDRRESLRSDVLEVLDDPAAFWPEFFLSSYAGEDETSG